MRNFMRLVRLNWLLAMAALTAVAMFRVLLWVLPFRWLHRCSQAASVLPNSRRANDSARRRRVAAAVTISSSCVPQATCLTQALAVQWLLRCCGDYVPLSYGVAGQPGRNFVAHAWLEDGYGVLVGDLPDLQRYQILGGAVR